METTYEPKKIEKILSRADQLLDQLNSGLIEGMEETRRIQVEAYAETLKKRRLEVLGKQIGIGLHFWINIILILSGYVPGLIHAIWIMTKKQKKFCTRFLPRRENESNNGEQPKMKTTDAFDQIRQNAVGNAAIVLRMLRALETTAGISTSPSRRRIPSPGTAMNSPPSTLKPCRLSMRSCRPSGAGETPSKSSATPWRSGFAALWKSALHPKTYRVRLIDQNMFFLG